MIATLTLHISTILIPQATVCSILNFSQSLIYFALNKNGISAALQICFVIPKFAVKKCLSFWICNQKLFLKTIFGDFSRTEHRSLRTRPIWKRARRKKEHRAHAHAACPLVFNAALPASLHEPSVRARAAGVGLADGAELKRRSPIKATHTLAVTFWQLCSCKRSPRPKRQLPPTRTKRESNFFTLVKHFYACKARARSAVKDSR
jgi:hypothetical protein